MVRLLPIVLLLSALSLPAYTQDASTSEEVHAEEVTGEEAEIEVPTFPGEPDSGDEALEQVSEVVDAFKLKNWAAAVAGIAFLIMFLARQFGLWVRWGKRWAYLVLLGLALVSAVLSAVAGGAAWFEALIVGVTTPGLASLVSAFQHGVQGQEHTTPMRVG